MEILIAIALIVALTLVMWGANRFLPFTLCPICAGVSGTWILLSIGVYLDIVPREYMGVIALLMGGSVVGIAYQGEKSLGLEQVHLFLFKAPMIVGGFFLAYLAMNHMSLLTFFLEAALLTLITYLYFIRGTRQHRQNPPADHGRRVENLKKRLEDCC